MIRLLFFGSLIYLFSFIVIFHGHLGPLVLWFEIIAGCSIAGVMLANALGAFDLRAQKKAMGKIPLKSR